MKHLNHKQYLRTTSCFLIHLQGLLGAMIFAAFFIILPTQAYAANGYTVRIIYYDNQNDAYSDNYGIFFEFVDTDNEKNGGENFTEEEFSFDTTYEGVSERKPTHQLFITAPANHVGLFPRDPIPRSKHPQDLPSPDSPKYKSSQKISYISIQKRSQVKNSYILHLYTETEQKLILLASINASKDIYDELTHKDSFRKKWFPNHPTVIEEIPEGVVPAELQYEPERTSSTTSSLSSTDTRADSMTSRSSSSQYPITQTASNSLYERAFPPASDSLSVPPPAPNPLYIETLPLTSLSSGYQTQPSSLYDTNSPGYEPRYEDHPLSNAYPDQGNRAPHLPGAQNKGSSFNPISTIAIAASLTDLHIKKGSNPSLARSVYSRDTVFLRSHESDPQVSFEHNNPTYQDSNLLDQPMCNANFLSGLSFFLFSQSAGQQPRWVVNIIEALFKASTRILKLNHLFKDLSPAIVRLASAKPNDLLVRKTISDMFETFHQSAQALSEWFEIYGATGIDFTNINNRDSSVTVDFGKACNAIQSAELFMLYYSQSPGHTVYANHGHIPKEVYWSKSVLQRHTTRLQELKTICAQGLDSLPHLITINGAQVSTIGAIHKLVVNTYNYLPYIFLATYIDYFLKQAAILTPPTKELQIVTTTTANFPQLVVSEYIAQAHRMGLKSLPDWLISLITQLQARTLPQQAILQTQRPVVTPEFFEKTIDVLNTLTRWESIPPTDKLKKENVVQLARSLSSIEQATNHFQRTDFPTISCTRSPAEFLTLLANGTFKTHKRQSLADHYKPRDGWFSGDKRTWESQAIQSLDILCQHCIPHVNTYLMYNAGVRKAAGVKK